MSHNWQTTYDELTKYITSHPTIQIGMNVVRLDDDVRPGFYLLFGEVCKDFLNDNFSDLLEKGSLLGKNWGELSKTVRDSLNLESIDVDAGTGWFLLDANDGLTRGLFDTLFDLLKGKTDSAVFEQTARQIVMHEFTRFYHQGYQSWITLALLKQLSTDKIYQVPTSEYDSDPGSHTTLTDGSCEESAPVAAEPRNLSLEPRFMYSFMVPRLIAHSGRLDLFAAFGSDFDYNVASWKVKNPSDEMEWYKISDIQREFGYNQLWPDLAIYLGGNYERLTVTADYWRMARPDVILEFREDKDWFEKEGLEQIKQHYNVLKPKLGTFVICLDPVPAAALEKLEEKPALQPVTITPETMVETVPPLNNIHLLSVGYDISRLESIIEAMLTQTRPT